MPCPHIPTITKMMVLEDLPHFDMKKKATGIVCFDSLWTCLFSLYPSRFISSLSLSPTVGLSSSCSCTQSPFHFFSVICLFYPCPNSNTVATLLLFPLFHPFLLFSLFSSRSTYYFCSFHKPLFELPPVSVLLLPFFLASVPTE